MAFEANIPFIRDSLTLVYNQLENNPSARLNNDIKATASKVYSLLSQSTNPVDRFYFIYLICSKCSKANLNKVDKLMKLFLPSPPTAQSLSLISDIISYALCHPSEHTSILDNMSCYLNISDLINVDMECWQQADTLAIDSPSFCSALISRSDLPRMNIDKKLLARWLQDLSKSESAFPMPSLSQSIRYSLFYQPPDCLSDEDLYKAELANSDFHFGILTIIQCRRCQNLTNQFLIDVVSNLAQKVNSKDNSDSCKRATILVDRFAQILSVAAASKVTTITNALRNSLSKLDSNQLIAALIQWQNK